MSGLDEWMDGSVEDEWMDTRWMDGCASPKWQLIVELV